MDLSALKQEIQDDAGLLSNWRKAFPGCRGLALGGLDSQKGDEDDEGYLIPNIEDENG